MEKSTSQLFKTILIHILMFYKHGSILSKLILYCNDV